MTTLDSVCPLACDPVVGREPVGNQHSHYFLQYSDAVIEPLGESLTNPELFSRLAGAMGFEEPELAGSCEELLHAALGNSGERFDQAVVERLEAERIAPVRFAGGRELIQLETDFPTTSSGRIEYYPAELGGLRYKPAPPGRHPLTLLSPASERTINS